MASTAEFLRRIRRAGFTLSRTGKKHDIYADRQGREVVVPRHSKELCNGTYHSMLRDAGLEGVRNR